MTMRNELQSAVEQLEALGCRRVLCAVSGGMDSMCLLHVVRDWSRESGAAVTAAHFNHRLRGEAADRDEAFVREICGHWGVPCVTGSGDTRALAERDGLSMEEAARTLRYRFLEQTAEEQGCEVILTAHHAEDNAETMLLNLIRGTGLRGLAGIPPRRGRVARIFLETPRETLRAYAEAHGIPWVEDETNLDVDAAARNLLRWKVLPLLREVNPAAVSHMAAAAARLWEVEELVQSQIDDAMEQVFADGNTVSIPLRTVRALSGPVRSGVFLALFERLGAGRKDVGRSHIEALTALTDRESGQLDLPHGVCAFCRSHCLYLSRKPQENRRKALLPGRPCHWGGWVLTLLEQPAGEGLTLCAGELTEVGPCTGGERLYLPEARGARTVKRLCMDRGITPRERERLPAIYVNNRLAAVWRLGVDQTFQPEGNSRRFIQIFKETEESNYEE